MPQTKTHLQATPVSISTYTQLKQLWEILEQLHLTFFNHTPEQALSIATHADLDQAAELIHNNDSGYQSGVQTGRWRLTDGLKHDQFDPNTDILCHRWDYGYSASALTNVPRRVVHHSPSGHEWGYGGSGPSDLALDILNWYLPARPRDRVHCWQGQSDRTAWNLHILFRNELIASLPRSGGTIRAN